MTITPWKILESQYFRPRFRTDKVELPNGRVFEPIVFEFRSWANVLALTKDQQVVLVRQYRHGVQKVLYEFPGGVIEDGEQPVEGVRRELLEETALSQPRHTIEQPAFFRGAGRGEDGRSAPRRSRGHRSPSRLAG